MREFSPDTSVGELESFADGSVRIGEFYFSQPGVGEVLLEDLFLKYDPEISVSFGITDLGDPSLFALSVITPIDPVGTPNVVAGSLTGYLPDFNQDGVSPTPYYTEGLMPAFVGYGGSPLTDIFYLGDLCSAGAGSADFLCGFYTYGPVAGPVPLSDPWDYLGISINLTLSGVGDSAIFSATASIDPGTVPVPEPATMLLFGSGLLGLAGLKRKIKKS